MREKYKIFVKNSFIFAIGSIVPKAILFVLVPLYTNYMSTSEYGFADLLLTISSLITPVLTVSIWNAVLRFAMMKDEKIENVVCTASVIMGIFSLLTVSITILFGRFFLASWKWYICCLVLLTGFIHVEENYIKAKGENRLYALMSIIQAMVLALTNVITIVIFRMGIKGYLLSNILSLLVYVAIGCFVSGLYRDVLKGKISKNLLISMIVFSAPIMINDIIWWALTSSDRIMIEFIVGSTLLGLYTIAVKIPAVINIVIAVFNQTWGVSSIREMERGFDPVFASRIFEFYSLALIGVSLLMISLIKPFFLIFVGKDFFEAWKYVPLLLVSSVFHGISVYYGALYIALKKTLNTLWTNGICAGVNIIVNATLIPRIGVWGAVIGSVVAFFVVALIRQIDMEKYISLLFEKKTYWLGMGLLTVFSVAKVFVQKACLLSIMAFILFILLYRERLKEITVILMQRFKV